jgi:hypothetical protein
MRINSWGFSPNPDPNKRKGLKPNCCIALSIRPINGTAKDIALINQYSYSKHYSLPSALADGYGRQVFLL